MNSIASRFVKCVVFITATLAGPMAARADEGVAVFVRADADPWLAGMPPGTVSPPDDGAPYQSPVEAAGVPVVAGIHLVFRATGMAGNTRNSSLAGPNGTARTLSHTNGSENGISDVTAPLISLLGVFLSDELPSLSAAPMARSFGTASSRNYSVLSPSLRQVFFIGSGTNAYGGNREVVVPAGATRLFLGTMDGFEWTNNAGGFTVAITWRRPASVSTNWALDAGGNGHSYEAIAVPGGISWSEASRFATNLNGYLACITSAEENAVVYGLIRDQPALWDRRSSGNSFGPWIGGLQADHAPEPAGGWGWVTGEPMVYINWNAGEPNNTGGVENRTHFFGSNAPAGDVWNDKDGNSADVYGFVVEYEITPDRAHLFASRVDGDGVRIQWISRIGSTYSLEWSPDIAIGPWQLLTRQLGNGGVLSVFDYPGGGFRFYRVVVEP